MSNTTPLRSNLLDFYQEWTQPGFVDSEEYVRSKDSEIVNQVAASHYVCCFTLDLV